MFKDVVHGFKDLDTYFLREKNFGCFVDTSVLFSQTYPLDIFNEESERAFEVLSKYGIAVFTNINVRAEFLENHRRVLIAECLIDILDSWAHQMDGRLSEKLKSHKTSYRKKIQEEKSVKIEISQIKVFRRLFSERVLMGKNGWEVFCENFLYGKLTPIWKRAEFELGLNFLTSRFGGSEMFFNTKPEWEKAVDLMGRYGMSSSDAMILNIFLCSKVPIFLTADLELAEVAAIEAKGQKQVFVPDSLVGKEAFL